MLNARKMRNWAEAAWALRSPAVDYEPSGMAENMEIFCAIPLAEMARDMED